MGILIGMLFMALLIPLLIGFFVILFMLIAIGVSSIVHRRLLKKDVEKYSTKKVLLLMSFADYGVMFFLYLIVSLFTGDSLNMIVFGMVCSIFILPISVGIFYLIHSFLSKRYLKKNQLFPKAESSTKVENWGQDDYFRKS